MRIFLTGVACIGKTTIGKKMAELLGCHFYDLDEEIEKFFETSVERLQSNYSTIHSFRDEASKVLVHVLSQPESSNSIISLPPSGLMSGYWRVVKKTSGIKIAFFDKPENILERIAFFDIDSNPIKKDISEEEKLFYLREIKKDMSYFHKTYTRADVQVNICCLNVTDAAKKTIEVARGINIRNRNT